MASKRSDHGAKDSVAFIGVGRMGSAMASRLMQAGYRLRVHDASPRATRPLADAGAAVDASAADAARQAAVVLLSLPTPDVVRGVITGSGGVLEGALAETLVVDLSTVGPVTARAMEAACEDVGVQFLDAPVSGGVEGAVNGSLTLTVGGRRRAIDRGRPVLEELSSRIVECGPAGAGQLVKLCHNLLTAMNTVAAGEVLAAGVRAGADLGVLREALSSGMADSRILRHLDVTLLTRERPVSFALDLMYKDLTLCLDELSDLPLPVAQLVRQVYSMARAGDLGARDSTSVIELYEGLLDVRLGLREAT